MHKIILFLINQKVQHWLSFCLFIMLAVFGPLLGGLPAMQYMALAMVILLLSGVFFFAIYLYVGNSKKIMGEYRNRLFFNIVLFVLFIINAFFGIMAIMKIAKG